VTVNNGRVHYLGINDDKLSVVLQVLRDDSGWVWVSMIYTGCVLPRDSMLGLMIRHSYILWDLGQLPATSIQHQLILNTHTVNDFYEKCALHLMDLHDATDLASIPFRILWLT